MSLTPVTNVRLRPHGLYTTPDPTYGTVQFLDLMDQIVINGVRYSPDLSTCYGAMHDPDGSLPVIRAYRAATWTPGVAIANYYTYPAQQGLNGDWSPRLNNGKTLMIRGSSTNGSLAGSAIYDPATNTLSTQSTTDPSGYTTHGGIVRGSEYWMIGMNTSYYPYLRRFDMATGATIGSMITVTGITEGAAATTWAAKLVNLSDGVGLITTTPGGAMYVVTFTSTTATYKTISTPASGVRSGIAVVGDGSFYSVDIAPSTRNIRYHTLASAAGTVTTTTCSGDFTPTSTENVVATSGDIDYRIITEVITMNGIKYLVCVYYALLNIPADTYNNPTRIVVYQIDANSPTILTLKANRTFARANYVLIVDNRIYCGRRGSIDLVTFTGNDVVLTDTFNVDARWLFYTKAGSVLAVNTAKLQAYNLTATTQKIVNCRFAQPTVKLTNNQPQTATLLLDVTDGGGTRLAVDVDLFATGATFDGGGTTARVTTSDSQTSQLQVTITNPGAVSVVPNIV